MGKQWKQWQTLFFWRSKITADGDFNHEIKSFSSPWKESYDQPNSILKSRDITLPTKVYLVKAMVFPVVMYGCESCTVKKAEHQRTDAFKLWCWRRLLRVFWTARRSNQSILKEISPACSLEGLMWMVKTRDLFKKIRDTKGTYHAKMGSIKHRNGMDLTEAEDIKKRWQNTQKNCTKKIFKSQIVTMVWSLT